jgi:hypothetical protein
MTTRRLWICFKAILRSRVIALVLPLLLLRKKLWGQKFGFKTLRASFTRRSFSEGGLFAKQIENLNLSCLQNRLVKAIKSLCPLVLCGNKSVTQLSVISKNKILRVSSELRPPLARSRL